MTKESIECTFREAIPDDAEALIDFVNRTREQTVFLSEDEPLDKTVEEERQFLANIYEAETTILLLALVNEEIVGTVSILGKSKKKFAHIGELGIAVDKDYWGFGIGSVLIEEVLHWAKQTGKLKRVELDVYEGNERAIHVYQKAGFKVEAKMEYGVKMDDGYHSVLLMSNILE